MRGDFLMRSWAEPSVGRFLFAVAVAQVEGEVLLCLSLGTEIDLASVNCVVTNHAVEGLCGDTEVVIYFAFTIVAGRRVILEGVHVRLACFVQERLILFSQFLASGE